MPDVKKRATVQLDGVWVGLRLIGDGAYLVSIGSEARDTRPIVEISTDGRVNVRGSVVDNLKWDAFYDDMFKEYADRCGYVVTKKEKETE